MLSNPIPLPLIPAARSRRTRSAPLALQAVVAGLMIVLPAHASGQIAEERDRDEPPVERPAGVPDETTPDLSTAEQMIVDQTNEFRKQEQLAAVEPNDKLNETAQYFADFMARTGKYSHTADGKRPSERADDHGYDSCIVAENIAFQFRSSGFTAEELAGKFVTGWKQSPEHRENMVDPDVTQTGVAIARSKDSSEYFAVQMFGRPRSESISFQVRNESDAEVEYTVLRRGKDQTFPLPPRVQRTHERCRPTKIEFSNPDKSLQVQSGAEYVVQRTSDGALEVESRK